MTRSNKRVSVASMIAVTALLAGCNCPCKQAGKADGFVPLFNSTDLSGWTVKYNPKDPFAPFTNYEKQENGQTLFTPAVRIFSGLDEALDELKDETIENRIRRFKNISEIIREGVRDLGFKILTNLEHASNTVTLIDLENRTYDDLYKMLKDRNFVIYKGSDDSTARFCTFGDLHEKDMKKFIKALREVK